MKPEPGISWSLFAKRLLRFVWHVLQRFHHRRGLLLASAVAYNVLLSVVPLGGVLLVTLSHFVEREQLFRVFSAELEHVLPGRAEALAHEVTGFWDNRELFGGLSLLVLLFFGSLAFRVLGDAMSVIFADVRREAPRVRGFWLSMAVPFLYVGVIGIGLIVLTVVSSLLEQFGDRSWSQWGIPLSLDAAQRWSLTVGGVVGELLLFASIYRVLPGIRVRMSHAVVAGFVATALWEGTRRLLLWYFAHASSVGLVYGSLTTVVVAVMSVEAAVVILLLGAQVVAELTHARQDDVPWYAIVVRS